MKNCIKVFFTFLLTLLVFSAAEALGEFEGWHKTAVTHRAITTHRYDEAMITEKKREINV